MSASSPVTLDPSSPFGVKRLLGDYWLLIAGLLFLSLTPAASCAESPAAKNVLILYSFSDRSVSASADALEASLRARVSYPLNFYVEYLECQRFDDKNYEKGQVEALQHTYSGEKLDLLVIDALPALNFALTHRNELFPGVPIVFLEVDARLIAGQKMWPGVTGITDTKDVPKTIDLILHLHPKTKAIAIITNNSPFERYWLTVVHNELLQYQNAVSEIDLVGIPTDQLPRRVAELPPETVVLFQEAPQESVHPAIGAYEALRMIGQRLPTYCIFPYLCLNRGGIGGADVDWAEQVSLAAEQGSRVLSGERPENIPVVHGTSDIIRVDWRTLRRWNIPESALPPGSEILYREPTFWQQDRKYILGAIAVILVQALWIVALLWQRARKRKAEAILRESEGRFRRMADTTPALVWMCDQRGKITYLNERWVEFTGSEPNAGYGDTWTPYVHPDDLKNAVDTLSQGLKTQASFSTESRIRRHDGVYRWMLGVASPRLNGDGSFAGFIGSVIDVTDQKLAQEALEKVSGQLIEAQEKERSRIARDLHDDICQRLALLSMELEQANRTLNGSSAATNERLEEIQQHCSEIAGDVQALSHQLHSSKLDYLGIVAAIRGFCKDYAKQHQVSIKFTDEGVPKHLPKDVSLCLFRVVQEALHNAVKYSGAAQFAVTLKMIASEIQLEVSDSGAGFDVAEAKGNGLGLVSMQERVHFVHGQFFVESEPGKGTRIIVSIPAAAAGLAANGIESASLTGAA
jgi:PAS domain S-box-containing protein